MGIARAFRLAQSGVRVDGIASPYTTNQLQGIVLGDIFEGIEFPLTRAEAMRVPAVAKARNLLAPTIGRQPLVALDKSGPVANQPAWLYRTDQDLTSVQWMWTYIVDDLIFYGAALLAVVRGSDGFPITMDRISPDRWTVTNGTILVDEKPVDERTVVYIPGVADALLDVGSRSIRQARDIEDAVAGRARVPNPTVVIQHTEGDYDIDQGEVRALMEAYVKNRRSPDGTVSYLPKGLEMKVLGTQETDFAIQARNASRTDIGAFVGIPSSVMDASLATASLTYSTAEGNRNSFYDQSLPIYAGPIEHRLSLDDVVPRGQRVRFDFTQLYAALPNPTDTPTED